MRKLIGIAVAGACLSVGLSGLSGCSTAPKTEEKRAQLDEDVQRALDTAERNDASLRQFLDQADGYAVFPSVGKGGAVVGGAYGRGEVFEHGRLIGYCDLTQGTVGLQLGGQTYTEIIAFQTPEALQRFQSGNFTFSANASAVALKSGAAAAARYANGVAVFITNEQGLMAEASIGGQKFSYQPIQ